MRTALITGASAGLGVEFIKAILQHMPEIDNFWLVARRKERLEEIASTLPVGKTANCIAADISCSTGWDILKAELSEKNPDVALLINCAGVGRMDNFADSDLETQVNMVNLNVAGLTAVTSLVLPYMKSGARIVNASSIASFCPNTKMTVYSSTKAYVSFFSRGLGLELKERGISVTAVCPGPMDTEFLGIAEIKSKTFDMLPHTSPEKVAVGTIKAAVRRKAVYTPGAFFKFYRVIAKLLPQSLMVHMAKT